MDTVGKRLLPSLVDHIAATDPDRILYSVPKTKDPQDGFNEIAARPFAAAVDRCSWYLEEHLGRGEDFPTLTYLGPQDLMYAILVLASIKTGYKLLLNSPRNTLEAHLSLFESTECQTFLLPPNFPLPIVKQILAARPMRVVEIPGVQHWTTGTITEAYPYLKTYKDARLEPFAVLHTSGSTGMPKPIVQTHRTISALDETTALPSMGQEPVFPAMCAGTRVYSGFPLFHCAGLHMLLGSIYAGFTVVLGPFPPSADVIDAIHVHGNVQHSVIASASVTDIAKNPAYIKNLRRIEQVTYGGGPLPQAVGDSVSRETRLLNCLGSTECGVLPTRLCDREDWAYLRYSPFGGSEFREVSEGLYEHVIVRDPKYEAYQGVFGTFPDLEEWSMMDLYSKHPSKKETWFYRGRADDIIVFSNGEKLNPIDMESIITTHSSISAALIIGAGRFQSSLLVEPVKPVTSDKEGHELIDTIWPLVQTANSQSPSHGRIHRDMIILTRPEKPMLRAGKGTVQRKMTVDLYGEELDALYNSNEDPNQCGRRIGKGSDYSHGTQDIHSAVELIVSEATGIDVEHTSADVNLFELGLDSLQVISITKAINQLLSMRGVSRAFEARVVYENASISALEEATIAALEGRNLSSDKQSPEQKMQILFDKYAANMPINARKPEPRPAGGDVVLLTGSTGSLGSYILDSLLRNAGVSYVYCLNRGSDSGKRQEKSQADKGLDQIPWKKVDFLDGDMSKPYFGLTTEKYKDLLREVTVVIHNAWQVDFNLGVESFESHIGTVRRFIDFSVQSRFSARLFFISSISAVAGSSFESPVPERMFESWSTAHSTGYGQSKAVSERLLNAATREAGIPTTVCRVGQIAGPTTASGMWPKQEWLPSLIASSKFLGKLPGSLGQLNTVDWIPVDLLGQGIVELATRNTNGDGAVVYHAVNPQKTTWASLVTGVRDSLHQAKPVEIVPYETWIKALYASASPSDAEVIAQNPAIKLLDFFGSLMSEAAKLVVLETRDTIIASPTLASLTEIKPLFVDNWMRQWNF